MQRVVIGKIPPRLRNSRSRNLDLDSGFERVVGYKDGYPVVVRKPPGRYVKDVRTGAIKFEHDLGPGAQTAAEQIKESMGELKETVKALQQPAQRTAMIVAGVIGSALVVAALLYYIGRTSKDDEE